MILVLGDIAVDIVSRLRAPLVRGSDAPAEVRVMPGGSGANVAAWLGRLGQRTLFIGRIGDDMFGHWLAGDLANEGVETALAVDARQRTGVIQVLVEPDGERTMIPDRGANAIWFDEDVPEDLIVGAALLHVVGYVLIDPESRRGALRAMHLARKHNIPISLDPSSHAPLQSLGAPGFWSVVGPVTLLLPNRAEASILSGQENIDAALEILVAHATVVAVKMDREGCLAAMGTQRWHVAAPPISVVDVSLTKNAFNAAFLAAWLRRRDVGAACRAGVALGSYAATLAGSR